MAIVLSTGTINKTRSTVNAHIELLNLSNFFRRVRVQVINWDSRTSLLDQTVNVSPNTNFAITTSVRDVSFHYEIRVTVPTTRNLIVNTFAVDSGTFTVENNTVLQHQLVRIFPPFAIFKKAQTKSRVKVSKKPLTTKALIRKSVKK
ncbi:hypothetical protein MJA45_21025 [Paenibacillus aurantius]|uniref:Uncharacterized protein n=1 Tax=Paenibacillus aurantius TaxID=2918900 RepID=A0AA96LBH9_9BACL|nr:hypothetical protein [Paenibacillus aurantius]WNQ10084.1 hypothetical protein MJA45_21025 [Paenibacillus aurantius]